MLNNIARIQRALTQAHLDAILLTDENDRRFATGFPSSDGAVIVTVHQAFFITDARYIEAARAALTGIAQVLLCSREAPMRTLVQGILREANVQILGGEEQTGAWLKAKLTAFPMSNPQDAAEYILQEALAEVKDAYDFIIIDCPPSLNMITVNALVAANTVLVPIQCEYFALEGLEQLLHTVNLVKKRLNPELEIEGIVFTMYDARTNLSLQVVEEVKRSLGQSVYRTIIPRNVRLGESPSHGLPINLYDPKSKGAEAYALLAEEVMEKEWN